VGFVRERPGTNSGVRYQALYDDVKGHRRSAGTFVTEAEATRAWQRAEDRQADGRSSDTRRTRQRFRYVEDQWLPHHEMEARTRETYTYYLNKHILPVFGAMRTNEIQPADVREWGVTPTFGHVVVGTALASARSSFSGSASVLIMTRGAACRVLAMRKARRAAVAIRMLPRSRAR
jgi:hypothetical protein